MQVPGVGDKLAKNLIAYCGSARAVFEERKTALKKIPGIGSKAAAGFSDTSVLTRAEEELEFILKHSIRPLFYLDEDYPKRLKLCEDGPINLFFRGNVQLNKRHALAMVGTRNATSYGLEFCEWFIRDLKGFNPLIVSGLAYGIDAQCHKMALHNGIPTVGVLGHGLDRIYPQLHTRLAGQMEENGGLLTEFLSGTNPDRENFPKRNRIVAGICDAVIVVEAAKSGGALITAEIANTYNREVFAVPGRLGHSFSEGCNHLIKTHRAALIEKVDDLKYILGWEEEAPKQPQQQELFVELVGVEQEIWKSLQMAGGKQELTSLCLSLNLPVNKALQSLMNLELRGLVQSRPGKVYALKNK